MVLQRGLHGLRWTRLLGRSCVSAAGGGERLETGGRGVRRIGRVSRTERGAEEGKNGKGRVEMRAGERFTRDFVAGAPPPLLEHASRRSLAGAFPVGPLVLSPPSAATGIHI
jgi:hypothetical protein